MTSEDVTNQDSCSDESPSQANAISTPRDIADPTAAATSIHDMDYSCIAHNHLPRGNVVTHYMFFILCIWLMFFVFPSLSRI